MEKQAMIFIIFSIFLVIGISIAGCSDSEETAAPETSAPATPGGPLYTAGDIVRSASGTESPAWLVVSYNSQDDSYTRALIYKNADGSYGYRTGSATDTTMRAMMERVYTVKITHVNAESVPTSAPAPAATISVTTSSTTQKATTTTTVTTTVSYARPSIKKMAPEEGEAGATLITEITGSDFAKNVTATLRHSNGDRISARAVSWYSSSSVTCTFDLSNETKVGVWDIVLTNPDGQSGEITNYFMVRGNNTVD